MELTGSRGEPPVARVLIVDDDPESRRSMRRVLEDAGWAVADAAGAEEALGHLRTSGPPFSVVVLDIVLAGNESGIELAGRLHRENRQLGFLFVSGYADLDVSSASVPHERTSFLAKPLSPSRLREEVEALQRRAAGS